MSGNGGHPSSLQAATNGTFQPDRGCLLVANPIENKKEEDFCGTNQHAIRKDRSSDLTGFQDEKVYHEQCRSGGEMSCNGGHSFSRKAATASPMENRKNEVFFDTNKYPIRIDRSSDLVEEDQRWTTLEDRFQDRFAELEEDFEAQFGKFEGVTIEVAEVKIMESNARIKSNYEKHFGPGSWNESKGISFEELELRLALSVEQIEKIEHNISKVCLEIRQFKGATGVYFQEQHYTLWAFLYEGMIQGYKQIIPSRELDDPPDSTDDLLP